MDLFFIIILFSYKKRKNMNDPYYFGQLLYLHAEILSKLYLPIQNSHGVFTFGPANKDRHETKSLVSWL